MRRLAWWARRRAAGERGATAVEFAFVLMILLLLIIGAIEFGRLLSVYQGAVTASREGARYGTLLGDGASGVPRYVDCGGIRDTALALLPDNYLTSGDITVQHDNGPGSSTFGACGNASAISPGDRVVVTVSRTVDLIGPWDFLPGGGAVNVSATDRRTIMVPPT